ncbi:MAG: NHLP family bacteriocin export ABC transporter peptidase/permease/ATPase subunit [Planctomycetes bacterium]|nr:NHLP family bacteriocin export ABC transporter peptidase/permease/ATPase subunit [Planctomycetota bacterium]
MMNFLSRIKATPTLLQMEAVECGAAALGIIMRHYGLFLPLEQLREECGVNRDGSNALNIIKAARRFGMTAQGYRLKADDVAKKGLPAIIHWNFNHFVVLEGFKGGKAYLNDPAVGHRSVDMEEFRSAYTGIAMVVKPGEGFQPGGSKFNVWRAIVDKLSTEKMAVAFVVLIGLMLILPGLATPVFNQTFVDDILSGAHPNWMEYLLVVMAVIGALNLGLTALQSWCLTRWQTKLTIRDSGVFFWHVLRLPMSFFQQRFSGEIAMRVSLNEKVSTVLTGQAATVGLDFFIAVFFLLLLIQYSWRLTLIGVFFSLINIALFYLVRKRLLELSLRVQQEQGKVMAAAINGFQAMETLKANGNEADFFSRWSGYYAKYSRGSDEIASVSRLLVVGPQFFGAINTALIMLIGGFQIMDGLMTAGVFMAFRSLMDSFQAPLNKILGLSQTLQSTEMEMQRLGDVLNYDIDRKNYPAAEPAWAGPAKLSGRVELENVTFGYSPLEKPLISDFNLTIEPGRWVALIGSSGSGKSTIARVVSNLFHPWSGAIKFDGHARADVPKEVLVNSIACVSQEVSIFSGTVRENLSLFDSSLPDRDIQAAARDARIHDDIVRLEGGYEHEVAEGGANFSGGQRQRLEIGRALSGNPSILILDEATSALDPITEENVLTNIRRRGCSCLVVAHRLSAFRDCDEIIVLENGIPVQRGTHSAMIGVDGPYRRLVAQQDEAKAEA